MKYSIFAVLILLTSLLSMPALSQTEEPDALGLPGDNLDLFAVLDLFQKSPTIEGFEKSLNDSETGINNLDLNLDEKVDFIKVTTEQDGDDFAFILQVDISEDEAKDVAVILLSKEEDDKVTLQIVGDQELYGDGYVVEPKPAAEAVTPNPAYTGTEPVKETAPASTSVVVVESAPIVQYVYSPVYVPYYPPYYYGYYPPYFRTVAVISVGIYRHNNYYHHYGYHGGYGNTVVVRNTNHYNNYYGNRPSNGSGNRPSNGTGNRPSRDGGDRPSNGSGTRPSQQPSNPSASQRPSNPNVSQQPARPSTNDRYTNPSAGTRQSNQSPTTRQAGATPSTRQSGASPSNRQASPSTRQASPTTRQSGSYSGGGRSGGGRSGGSFGGGGRSGGGRR